jgi:hypothetical protein
MMYPTLLPLMRTPRLPVVDWTDAPGDLNGLVRFAERRNMVSARVSSHFKRSLSLKGFHVDDFVLNLFVTFSMLFFSINCVYWPGGLAQRFTTRIENESLNCFILESSWYLCTNTCTIAGVECLHLHALLWVVITVRTGATRCFG